MKTTTESLQLTGFEEILEDRERTVSLADYSLLTDLYQLTMAACYVGEGLDGRAAGFELFARRLPEGFWTCRATAFCTGDVWAVPEGTAVVANEPLLLIEAHLWQGQLVETYLL